MSDCRTNRGRSTSHRRPSCCAHRSSRHEGWIPRWNTFDTRAEPSSTTGPWPVIADDLARLARPGIDLEYRCTGDGPRSIRDRADAIAAAPFVVRTVRAAELEGFDAAVVDCTDDPGVAAARATVSIPVIGPGEAMAAALAGARRPVCHFSGDDLRGLDADALVERSAGARTAALGGTGFSHVADLLVHAHPGLVVLDPLAVALDVCLAAIAAAGRRMP